MEPLAAASVTSSSDELGATSSDVVPSSSPTNLESSASPVHSISRLSGRRWSVPDNCGVGSDSVQVSQQCCHSVDVSSKQPSDWQTVESGVINLQPTTHLIYSGVPSRASPQHSILPVFSSFSLQYNTIQ